MCSIHLKIAHYYMLEPNKIYKSSIESIMQQTIDYINELWITFKLSHQNSNKKITVYS